MTEPGGGAWTGQVGAQFLVWLALKSLKYLVGFVVISVVALLAGIIANAHLQVSLKRPSLATSWRDIVDVDLDLSKVRTFEVYFGENNNGKTELMKSTMSLSYFRLSNKVVGTMERTSNQSAYSIVGFHKEDRIVLAHRGDGGGEGIYIMDYVDGQDFGVFAGFAVWEDSKFDNRPDVWIIRCPILMLPTGKVRKPYDSASIVKDFPFISSPCTEFKMVATLKERVIDGKPIEDALRKK